jgi:hypothetical protein
VQPKFVFWQRQGYREGAALQELPVSGTKHQELPAICAGLSVQGKGEGMAWLLQGGQQRGGQQTGENPAPQTQTSLSCDSIWDAHYISLCANLYEKGRIKNKRHISIRHTYETFLM